MKIRILSLVLFGLLLTSCGLVSKWKKDDQPQIRIVDLQGKSHPVVTKVPELNAKALAAQGQQNSSPIIVESKKPIQVGEVKYQNYQDQNLANAQATSQFPQGTKQLNQEQPGQNDDLIQAGKKDEDQVVEYDLTENKTILSPKKSGKKTAEKKSSSKKSEAKSGAGSKGKYFVQVGSFSTRLRAQAVLEKMQKYHSGKIEVIEGEKTIYRSLLGPFPTKEKALELSQEIKSDGHDAIIVKNK
jgi:cell division protein FtsN